MQFRPRTKTSNTNKNKESNKYLMVFLRSSDQEQRPKHNEKTTNQTNKQTNKQANKDVLDLEYHSQIKSDLHEIFRVYFCGYSKIIQIKNKSIHKQTNK